MEIEVLCNTIILFTESFKVQNNELCKKHIENRINTG